MEQLTQFEPTKEFLDSLKEAIDIRDDDNIRNIFENVNPADISITLHHFNTEDSKYVVELLEKEVGAEIINDLDEDTRTKFLKSFTPEEIAVYIDILESDDAVDILNEQAVRIREEIIAAMENEEKIGHILDLLRYEEDVAGGLMAKELIKANLNWTVDQCIDEIRRQAENVEKIYSVYVVDDQNRLLGRVGIKNLLLAQSTKKVMDIYDEDLEAVETYMPDEEVAAMMRKYDLDAVPVVNVQGKLMGRITIDDIVDLISEQAEEERQLMSGISEDVEEADSVWMLTRARLPWLVIGLVGGIIGAQFIEIFEKDLAQVTAIAFFIPLIIATGGNVGIQSSALIVQSLANPSIFSESILRRLVKVFLVALLNGILLAGLVFLFIYWLNSEAKLAIVVSSALFSVVVLASFLGTFIPLILDKMNINPALASGPFITTTIDLLGLAVYFLVAHQLYNF